MSSRETVTEKRTVIKSSSSNYDDLGDSVNFKSSITPRRSNVIQRSSTGPGVRSSLGSSSGGSSYVRTVEYGYGSSTGLGPGGYQNVSSTGVNNVKSTREREKKDMQELNERFANYIEKVRFLEAQNRKLASELEQLRDKWGKETSAVKQMYEAELAEARKLIDDLTRDKSALEIKNQSLQEQMQDMRRQLDDAKKYRQIDRDTISKLNQQLSDSEAEINMLRRSVESLETDRARDRDRINKLEAEVDRLRVDLNNETLNHLDAENRRQTLEEEMEFLKKVHEQELKELAALAYRDTTEENREFWKSELAQAIRDIQKEYDSKVDQIRGDMEGFYNLKIQEFRTGATKQNMEVTHVKEENKKLIKQMTDLKGRLADLEARNAQLEKQYQDLLREYESIESEHAMETNRLKEEITSLRAEMESILQEMQTIMDTKLSMELEIAAYRKLLESEESRNVAPWRSQKFQQDLYRNEPEPDEQPHGLPEPKPVPEPEPERDMEDERTERDLTPDEDSKSMTEEKPGNGLLTESDKTSEKGDEVDQSAKADVKEEEPVKEEKSKPTENEPDQNETAKTDDSEDKTGNDEVKDAEDKEDKKEKNEDDKAEKTQETEDTPNEEKGKEEKNDPESAENKDEKTDAKGEEESGNKDESSNEVSAEKPAGEDKEENKNGDVKEGTTVDNDDTKEEEKKSDAPTENNVDESDDKKGAGDDDEDSQMSMKMMRGEVSAKTTYQRTSNGPISISEVSPEAKFITLENTSSGANRREVNLEGWKLKRCVDGGREYIYNFRSFNLKPGKCVKVFARGAAADASMNDLIFREEESWGVGSQVTTCLVNDSGEEKATHTQKTLYN